ncbi:hypothetical protein KS4_06360 [Poriferisphaera corsica]|uniref:Uncharacterized protein n=1 Tax=Poriferisphaera corsica TaxID=2528020 RepID=A0A517YQU2_9BACT|nr:hypothetical protein [Poriferisphaera corsica]QDU32602.1 hypothetical protein KS4_06360 [Poriferisphaera corsica]
MPEINIGTEIENSNSWIYDVAVKDSDSTFQYKVTLNFADYELWCGGTIPPSKVVHKAFLFLLQNEPASAIMSKFDCAVIRRYFPQVDKELPKIKIDP